MAETHPEQTPQPDATDHDDVTVTTKLFALTPKAYFQILLGNMFGKHWWYFPYAATILLVLELARWLFLGYFGHEPHLELAGFYLMLEIVMFAFLVVYYGWIYFYLRSVAYHPSNKAIMHPRNMTLSRNKLVAQASSDDAGESNVWVYKREDIFQATTRKWCYLFFLTPHMFVYVSKDAFQNDTDRELFEKTILPAYPRPKSMLKRGILYYFLGIAIITMAVIVTVLICLTHSQ
jgi:hypothetical protein